MVLLPSEYKGYVSLPSNGNESLMIIQIQNPQKESVSAQKVNISSLDDAEHLHKIP